MFREKSHFRHKHRTFLSALTISDEHTRHVEDRFCFRLFNRAASASLACTIAARRLQDTPPSINTNLCQPSRSPRPRNREKTDTFKMVRAPRGTSRRSGTEGRAETRKRRELGNFRAHLAQTLGWDGDKQRMGADL